MTDRKKMIFYVQPALQLSVYVVKSSLQGRLGCPTLCAIDETPRWPGIVTSPVPVGFRTSSTVTKDEEFRSGKHKRSEVVAILENESILETLAEFLSQEYWVSFISYGVLESSQT
jgi:hypothetical protein